MYWMKYAGKSLRGNWKSYLIFGVFLTIVFAAWSIVSVFSEKNASQSGRSRAGIRTVIYPAGQRRHIADEGALRAAARLPLCGGH